MSYGRIESVSPYIFGSDLSGDHATGATTLQLDDVLDFPDPNMQTVQAKHVASEEIVTVSTLDDSAGTLALSAGIATDYADGDRIEVYPQVIEHRAEVRLDDAEEEGETVECVVPHTLWDKIGESIAPDTAVEIDDTGDIWYVVDVLGEEPAIQGQYVRDITNASFAQGLRVPKVVTELPTYPYDGYEVGDLVVLNDNSSSDHAKLFRLEDASATGTSGWTKAVDGGDILANSIVAGSIAAGAIGAEQMAAVIVLSSLFTTRPTGTGTGGEFDQTGLRAYDASDNAFFNLNFEEGTLNLAGDFVAYTMDAIRQMVVREAMALAANGVFTLDNQSVSNPAVPPTVEWTWETATITGMAADPASLSYHSASSKFWAVDETNGVVHELNSSFASVRSVAVADATSAVRVGNKLWVLTSSGAGSSATYSLKRFSAADVGAITDDSVSVALASLGGTPTDVDSDGTDLLVLRTGVSWSWNKHDATTGAAVSGVSVSATPSATAVSITYGEAAVWIGGSDGNVYKFSTTGTADVAATFKAWSATSSVEGLAHDGTRFWTHRETTTVHKHTNWVPANATLAVAYAWYDSVSGYETTASFTYPARTLRARLRITVPQFPSAANRARIYVAENHVLGPFEKQVDASSVTSNLDAWETSFSDTPKSASTFPTATPAKIVSATGGLEIHGNGNLKHRTIGARVYKSVAESTATATAETLLWDQEEFDSDLFHSTTTNTSRITIPSGMAGRYRIEAAVEFQANATGQRLVRIKKNGVDTIAEDNRAAPSARVGQVQAAIPNLAVVAGDYFEVEVLQNSGGALNVNAGTYVTWFSVMYVGAS